MTHEFPSRKLGIFLRVPVLSGRSGPHYPKAFTILPRRPLRHQGRACYNHFLLLLK